MDKAVEGPMTEAGAIKRAAELNAGKSSGDIKRFDHSYFTDFQIRRMKE